MNNKNLFRRIIGLIVVLGILILVSGCSPKEAEKSEANQNEASIESETVSKIVNEASSFPKIGKDQPFYDFYNKVAINQTKAEVASVLGVEPVIDAGGSYTYLDPSTGYAVNVVYSASDLVTMKVLIPPIGGGEWFKLSPANVTESQVASIVEGMTYKEVKDILGSEGLEAGVMINPEAPDQVLYLLIWLNSDFSSITVIFDGETGKVFIAEFSNAPV